MTLQGYVPAHDRRSPPVLTYSQEQFLQEVHRLKAAANGATTDAEVREITSRIASISRKFRIVNGIGLPMSPMEQAMEVNPRYTSRPHLEYLSDRITNAVRDVERGQNRKMIVSMPPRAGKSFMTSLYTPLWLLRRHPEWKVALVSYSSGLVRSWAKELRDLVEDHPDLGVALKPDGGAAGRWNTIEGGGMFTTEVGGDFTGYGAKVLVIDDPVKDYVAAHNPKQRQALWDWWLTVASTRMEGPYLQFCTMCMTGDTPVLRPDGTTTPLAELRRGDEVATFTDEGEVTTSVVSNWASQGEDDILTLSMASGRVVRANARHPFWVIDETGEGSWVQLGSLQAGMQVRCLTAPTEELSAQSMTATSQRSARVCACRTTLEPATQQGIGHHLPHMKAVGRSASRAATESLPRSMINSSLSRVSDVRSVEDMFPKSPSLLTGPKSSASITATTPESCEVCSATTATLSLLALTRLTTCAGPLSTSIVTFDEVVSVEPSGREEVFDIEVVGTHRFIANGLDVSNTRWHEDDFAGRLLSPEWEGDPRDWEQIVLPALADREDDPLGREVGQPLYTPLEDHTEREAIAHWEEKRESTGSYAFAAMYQQRPAPAKGAIFSSNWWRYWTRFPESATADGLVVHVDPGKFEGAKWIDSWDAAFKGSMTSDWVVGQRWCRWQANRYLTHQVRKRMTFTQTIEEMLRWAEDNPISSPNGRLVHKRLIEDKANGPAIIDTLKDKIAGIKPVQVRDSKEARARAVTPEVESGNVYLPFPGDPGNEWVLPLVSELSNFPHDVYDDQVDALTQALSELRDAGTGMITVPGRRTSAQQLGLPPGFSMGRGQRDIGRAAANDMNRRRGM